MTEVCGSPIQTQIAQTGSRAACLRPLSHWTSCMIDANVQLLAFENVCACGHACYACAWQEHFALDFIVPIIEFPKEKIIRKQV